MAILETLLDPLPRETFLRTYWERRHVHVVRNRPDAFRDLLTLADVDGLVSWSRPHPQDRGIVHGTQSLLSSVRGETPSEPTGLYAAYNSGGTINVNMIQRRWPAIGAWCRALEEELSHHVSANLYLTPPESQGFEAHFDDHNVFVLQIEGRKKWRLYDGGPRLPLIGATYQKLTVPGDLLDEVVLQPGDVLYLPRGVVHEARTEQTLSLHVTVGVFMRCIVDLAKAMLDVLALDSLEMRQALPVGTLTSEEDSADVRASLIQLFERAADQPRVEQAIARLRASWIASMDAPGDGHFESLRDLINIAQDTVLERRAGMPCSTGLDGDTASIQFPGNQVSGPASILPALEFIARSSAFRVRDLPGSFSDNSRLVLARRLVREGLLRIAQSEVRPGHP
jgi:ribosomal protein L16 Arg81 hydroxylase